MLPAIIIVVNTVHQKQHQKRHRLCSRIMYMQVRAKVLVIVKYNQLYIKRSRIYRGAGKMLLSMDCLRVT